MKKGPFGPFTTRVSSAGGCSGAGPAPSRGGAAGLILGGFLLGALLMIVAEFTTLYHVPLATSSEPIKSVRSGSNHGYAIGLLGLIAAGLVLVAVRSGS